MAIVNIRNNPAPILLRDMACSTASVTISIPREDAFLSDFVFCECEYIERVFHKAGGLEIEKDRRSFLVENVDPGGSVDFVLLKGDQEINLIDNTYGEFYDFGSIPGHPQKKGFILDFQKVFNEQGNGLYQVRIDQTVFGTDFSETSHFYRLLPFSLKYANKTVKIESFHNNTVEAGLDYEGINWYKALRVNGRLGNREITLDEENYQNSDRIKEQIITEVRSSYTLEMELAPSKIIDQIIFDQNLATKIFLTNYDLFAFKNYLTLEVRAEEITTSEDFSKNKNGFYEIKFSNSNEGFISKNN